MANDTKTELTEERIREIVREEIPAWLKAAFADVKISKSLIPGKPEDCKI